MHGRRPRQANLGPAASPEPTPRSRSRSSAVPQRCSPRPGSWTPPRVMMRWTCDHAPRRPARPRRPGRHPVSGCGPVRAGPGRPGQRHGAVKVLLDPPASGLPTGDTIGGTCPASSSPCRQTGAAEQPGGSNRQLGRSEVRDNIERGIRRSSRAIQAPELTRQRLHAIRHRTYPPWHPKGPRTQQQRRLPRRVRAPLALPCPQDFADTGQRSAGPRPGGPDPPPNTGQDPADQRQHQDREQPPTKSHGQEHDPRLPDQRPATPRPHPQRHLSHA